MYELQDKIKVEVNDNKNENGGDMRSNRSVRNVEITEKEIINEKSSKNPIIFSIMSSISNTVSLMFFSTFVTLIVTKNVKWFYILLSTFIIVTCVEIIKIIMMRYNAEFLYRPGKCGGERSISDMLFYKNFILEKILQKIDRTEYQKRGFPSVHMTTGVSIITLTYLFFPKYRKITLMVAPVYIILLGYSRMYLNCHTLLQVICGIIAGMIGGKLMYNLFR